MRFIESMASDIESNTGLNGAEPPEQPHLSWPADLDRLYQEGVTSMPFVQRASMFIVQRAVLNAGTIILDDTDQLPESPYEYVRKMGQRLDVISGAGSPTTAYVPTFLPSNLAELNPSDQAEAIKYAQIAHSGIANISSRRQNYIPVYSARELRDVSFEARFVHTEEGLRVLTSSVMPIINVDDQPEAYINLISSNEDGLIENPVGLHVTANTPLEQLRDVAEHLNPGKTDGKLTFILDFNGSAEMEPLKNMLLTIRGIGQKAIFICDVSTVTSDGSAEDTYEKIRAKINATSEVCRNEKAMVRGIRTKQNLRVSNENPHLELLAAISGLNDALRAEINQKCY